MNIKDLTLKDNNINLEEYLNFYNYVKANMKDPSWLGNFNEEKLINILNMGGKICVYYLNDEIVCSMMFIPSDEQTLKLFNLPYNKAEVGECGPIMVNNKYIGYGLQAQMLDELDKFCKEKGYNYVLTTIAPNNSYSINNFIKKGYKKIDEFNLKRGVRSLYLKRV